MTKTITVFTPSYNRAYCLHKCYESLLEQSNQDFIWLIIDDGSTDNTKEIVASWIHEAKIDIQYHFQENQGMHGAHNTAYSLIETPLNVCIDSDDAMAKNGIEIMLNAWKKIEEKPEYAGLVGLDADESGNLIGSKIPNNIKDITLYDLYNKYGVTGDKKLVYRTDIVKKYPPYPIFKGERFVPLDYLYLLIDQDYHLAPLNEVLIIVDYQLDGSTLNIFKQYRKNPRGFAFSRISRIDYGSTFVEKLKNSIHLVSSSLFSRDFSDLFKTKHTLLVVLSIPLGMLLYGYVQYKTAISR